MMDLDKASIYVQQHGSIVGTTIEAVRALSLNG